MKSVLEIAKENGQWEKFTQEIKRQYTHKEVQERHLKNMERFLEGIQIKENWKVEIWADANDNIYGNDMFIDAVIKDEKDEYILFMAIELDTFSNRCEFEVIQMMMYFDYYNIDIETTFSEKIEEKTDLTKLLEKYDELEKIFDGVIKW